MKPDTLVQQRLDDLERVCRGLSHEANNWLYTVLGQTEMAEQYLRQVAVAHRYMERLMTRAERSGELPADILPHETLATLRRRLPYKTTKRRLDGLRRVHRNAEQLSEAFHELHMFAAARTTLTATVDLNAAVQAAVDLLWLGYYRMLPSRPQVSLDLAEGLPLVSGSAGLLMGAIIDLAADPVITAVQVATRREGEAVLIIVTVAPASDSGFEPALAAMRLCGGTITVDRSATATTYRLWLPVSETLAALRSESS